MKRKPENMIGVGIAIGVAFGVAIGNVGLGIALGVAIGAAMHTKQKNKIKMEMREASLASRVAQGSSAQQSQSPLAILADISRALPVDLEVELDGYFFNPPAVRLKGQAANFESVTRLEQRLKDSGHFGKVEVADARAAAADGGVDFQVDLGLAPAPDKR